MKKPKILELNALSISFLYLIFALVWIFLSDTILQWMISDPEVLSRYQTIKGFLYVSITAGLLYLLIENGNKKIQAGKKDIDNALKAANMATWRLNIHTRKSHFTNEGFDMLGFGQFSGEWDLQSFWNIIHEDDQEKVRQEYYDSVEHRKPYKLDYRIVWPDGSIKWMRSRGTLQEDQEGEPACLIGVVTDITEQKKLAHEYEKEKELFERIFETIPVMIDIYDPEVKKVRVNKAFERIMGWTNEELSDISLMHETYPNEKARKRAYKIMSRSDGNWHEFEAYTKYGEKRVQRWNNLKLMDDTTVGIGLDITEQKNLEKKLENERIELRNEKQRFELVANTTSDVIWDFDPISNEIWWSEGFEDIFGYKMNKLPKTLDSWKDHLHPEDKERVMDSLNTALATDTEYWSKEYRFVRANDSIAYIRDHGNIIRDEKGKAIRMIGTLNDLTETKRAEEKLKESEHKYRQLFKQNPHPMWIYNPADLRFIEVNEAAIQHYGYSEEEFLTMTIADIRPQKDVPALIEYIEEQSFDNNNFRREWTHLKKDGTEIDVKISSVNIEYKDHSYRIVLATDVTEQKQAEERVIASLVEGENRERKRLAQELHDGLGQYLAAANMNLDAMKNSIGDLSEKKHRQFQKGINFLKHAIIETRSISHNLMPRAVEDYGLSMALEALVDSYKKSTNISFYFFQNLDELKLDDEVAINIYRIAQEALTNAVKYSDASKVNIQLVHDQLDLILTIDDNGKGFDRTSADFKAGLGLQTIQTRTDAVSGYFEIDSSPGKGTLLNVVVPIGKHRV